MTSLDGVYAKIDRASRHAVDLRNRIAAATGQGSFAFERELDTSNNRFIYTATKLPKMDPEWSLVLGDFLTNLRASLDYLAWQLVLREGNTPDRHTSFPIHESNRTPKDKHRLPRIDGVDDPDVVAALTAVQPYTGPLGDDTEHDPRVSGLLMLKELVNIDKHHLLLVIAGALDMGQMYWASNEGDPTPQMRLNQQPLEVGDFVAAFEFGEATPPNSFDPHLGLQVRLHDGPDSAWKWSLSLENLLDRLYRDVEHAVLGVEFARFFGLGPRHWANVYAPRR